MDKRLEAVGLKMVGATREAVKRATDPLHSAIEELKALKPEKGDKGDAGKDFDPSPFNAFLEENSRVLRALGDSLEQRVTEFLANIPAPQPPDLAPFEEKALARISEAITLQSAALASAIEGIPEPENGKDADPEFIKAEIEKAVAALPKPKDGESVHPDTIARMVNEAVQAAVEKIRIPEDGKHGDPGKDALQIEPLPSIDEAKTYPRGTYATHLGGTIRAVRNTDPIGASGLEAAGWQVITDGVAGIVVTQSEFDPRQIFVKTLQTSGIQVEADFRIPMLVYRGVWKECEADEGDAFTWDGSIWIAQKKTTSKPGASEDFKLAVKRGRDGRDGGAAEHKSGPVRLK